jgi:branched-chain amino acid transport system permease protein
LLTFGLALLIEGIFRQMFGVSGLPYAVPKELQGVWNLGFMVLPIYRGWVVGVSVVVCVGIWALIEKTKLGAVLRAATENPSLLAAFGVNVPILMTATFCLGAGLAGLSGVLAAPIYSVNPLMGSNLIIVVFAVVVIGGMGSIMGAVITGFSLGLIEGLCKVFVPQITATAVFVIMAIVLLVRPAGLFGKRS